MTIFGREVHFFMSTGAVYDLQKLGEKDNYMQSVAAMVLFSQAYEHRKWLADHSYEEKPLTVDEVRALSKSELDQLSRELADAVKDGEERTVEVEEDKKKEA